MEISLNAFEFIKKRISEREWNGEKERKPYTIALKLLFTSLVCLTAQLFPFTQKKKTFFLLCYGPQCVYFSLDISTFFTRNAR